MDCHRLGFDIETVESTNYRTPIFFFHVYQYQFVQKTLLTNGFAWVLYRERLLRLKNSMEDRFKRDGILKVVALIDFNYVDEYSYH